MKKRILSVTLVLCMLLALLPTLGLNAAASGDIAYPVEGGNLYFNKSNGTITDCDDTVTSADIPSQIEGVAVTSIGEGAFYYCTSLSSVTIPESMTSIGDYAFHLCPALSSVVIPDSVVSLGSYMFSMSGLTSAIIGNGVTYINEGAFNMCGSLETVFVGENVSSIDRRAFFNCENLKSVYFFGNAPAIGDDLFGWFDADTNAVYPIPDLTLYYIGGKAGWTTPTWNGYPTATWGDGDQSDAEIIASGEGWTLSSDYVLTIFPGVFEFVGETKPWQDYSDFICSVVLKEGIEKIGSSAFWKMPALKTVSLPDSLEYIEMYAFANCPALSRIYIPKNVSQIGMWAFGNCSALTEITVDPENEYYTSDRFGALYNKSMKTLLCVPAGFEGTYIMPAEVIALGDGSTFYGCTGLTAINVDSGNTAFCSRDGVLFDRDMTRLVAFPAGVGGRYDVPSGVQVIANNAFGGAIGLKSVVFPESLTRMEYAAFEECTSLKLAIFRGDAPEMEDLVFQTYYADYGRYESIRGLTLYYVEGKAGWTSPTWNGFATGIWDGITVPETIDTVYFVDVSPEAWYYGFVCYVVTHNLMNGVGNDKFEPEESMTRAMLVTVLYRLAGEPTVTSQNPFSDVANGQWFTNPILWASENGIVNGVGKGKFEPEEPVTREQMATILHRYASKMGYDVSAAADLSIYPDVNRVNDWAATPLAWANAVGLINGTTFSGMSGTWLDPQGCATRAQVATILMRFCVNVIE